MAYVPCALARNLLCWPGSNGGERRYGMNFLEWWSEQSPFNKIGIAFVGAVIIVAIIAAIVG